MALGSEYDKLHQEFSTLPKKAWSQSFSDIEKHLSEVKYYLSLETQSRLHSFWKKIDSHIDELQKEAKKLLANTKIEVPQNIKETEILCRSLRYVVNIPKSHRGFQEDYSRWESEFTQLEKLTQALKSLEQNKRRYEDTLVPEAWDISLENISKMSQTIKIY